MIWTLRIPLMVEVMESHQAIGGIELDFSFPVPRTALLSYARARSASGVVRAVFSRRSCTAVAERGKASRAARRPARISMKRL